MRTFFSSPSATATLKKDCRILADDALRTARHAMDPALEAAHRAEAYARHAMHDAQARFSKELTKAERYASQQYDQTSRWVMANPFKSVGIALAIGMVVASLLTDGSKRR
ncbi:MAG: DUF883 family protein [Prosthecobacter sp.]